MELTPGITLAMLGAALLHASWNAIIKSSADKLLDTAIVCGGGALLVLPGLFVLPAPAAASWPWLAASCVLHVAYFFAVVGAYRAGDLSHGYPIMRGLAPLAVALASIAWFGEAPGAAAWTGIGLVCAGVLSLGFIGRPQRAATRWALANAVIIATYTMVDASGVRVAGDPLSYVAWMFFVDTAPFALVVLALRRGELLRYAAARWPRGLAGGGCSAVSYGVAVWAMTRAPVGTIAALRETSVIFGALIGSWLLKEGHVRARLAGAVVVAAGVAMLKS